MNNTNTDLIKDLAKMSTEFRELMNIESVDLEFTFDETLNQIVEQSKDNQEIDVYDVLVQEVERELIYYQDINNVIDKVGLDFIVEHVSFNHSLDDIAETENFSQVIVIEYVTDIFNEALGRVIDWAIDDNEQDLATFIEEY